MAELERVVGASADLVEGGSGVRFRTVLDGEEVEAFAVRFRGRPYAYVNRCAHVGIELDWVAGQFFDASGLYLVCATHGAMYEPDTGRCVLGPCAGRALIRLPIEERDGALLIIPR